MENRMMSIVDFAEIQRDKFPAELTRRSALLIAREFRMLVDVYHLSTIATPLYQRGRSRSRCKSFTASGSVQAAFLMESTTSQACWMVAIYTTFPLVRPCGERIVRLVQFTGSLGRQLTAMYSYVLTGRRNTRLPVSSQQADKRHRSRLSPQGPYVTIQSTGNN
jgi:hypothetical protein